MTTHLLGQRLTDLQRQVCKDMGEATTTDKLRQLADLGIPVLSAEACELIEVELRKILKAPGAQGIGEV